MWSQLLPGAPPDGWRRKPGPHARFDWPRLARGLTGCWLFNEDGGPARDALTADTASPPARAAGAFGRYGLSFTGTGCTTFGGGTCGPGFANGAQLSVLGWVNLSTTQSSKCFVSAWGNDGGGNNHGWALGISDGSNNVVKWYTATASGNQDTISSTTTLTNGLWYQCVGTWDGATKRLYVNGRQEASGSFSGTIPYTSTASAFGTLANTGGQNYSGLLDHCLIWDRALSAGEVLQLYQAPFLFLKPPAPAALYTPAPGGGGGGGGGGGHLLGTLGVGA